MAVETAATHLEDMPVVDVAQLTDYEQMKGKLAIEVVSLEANSDMLSKIPHQEMEDMAVVYRFVLGSDAEGRSSILVTNNLIENMGVTPEQFHADAIANAPEIRPAEIKGMSQVMMEMMGPEQFELMGMPMVTDLRDEATAQFARLSSKYSVYPEIWCQYGSCCMETGDYDTAIASFNKAAELYDLDLLQNVKLILLKKGQILQNYAKYDIFNTRYSVLVV